MQNRIPPLYFKDYFLIKLFICTKENIISTIAQFQNLVVVCDVWFLLFGFLILYHVLILL